jgi:hypothetical protein
MGSEKDGEARERAEAQFQKKAQAVREGNMARAEYAAVSHAVDEKTARLKSLRRAKEASDAEGAAAERPVVRKRRPK